MGDILVSVDGSKAIGMPPSQVVRKVRGAPGTNVELGLRRPPGPSGDPGELYVISLSRGLPRPVMQRAFGSPLAAQSSLVSRTSRGFIVL